MPLVYTVNTTLWQLDAAQYNITLHLDTTFSPPPRQSNFKYAQE